MLHLLKLLSNRKTRIFSQKKINECRSELPEGREMCQHLKITVDPLCMAADKRTHPEGDECCFGMWECTIPEKVCDVPTHDEEDHWCPFITP